MPIVHLKIPAPSKLMNGDTPVDDISLDILLQRVESNPVWLRSHDLSKALAAIKKGWEQRRGCWWSLADSDHAALAAAVKTPQVVLKGDLTNVVPGFGWHPRLATQIIPYVESILATFDEIPPEDPEGTKEPAE